MLHNCSILLYFSSLLSHWAFGVNYFYEDSVSNREKKTLAEVENNEANSGLLFYCVAERSRPNIGLLYICHVRCVCLPHGLLKSRIYIYKSNGKPCRFPEN